MLKTSIALDYHHQLKMSVRSSVKTLARTLVASTSRARAVTPQRATVQQHARAFSRTTAVSSPSADTHTIGTRNERPAATLKQCPKCSRAVLALVSPCPYCSTLLPIPEDVSHHALLGLSSPSSSDITAELEQLPCNGFELDVKDLRNRMLQRQRDFHPDRFQGQGDQLELAKAISSRINKAYGILCDDLKRAQYLLKMFGLPTLETDNMSDPSMLMSILEAREILEEAQSEEEVEGLREENDERIRESTAELKKAFAQSPPDLEGAKRFTIELKYWRGLEDAAREWKAVHPGQQREGKQGTCLLD